MLRSFPTSKRKVTTCKFATGPVKPTKHSHSHIGRDVSRKSRVSVQLIHVVVVQMLAVGYWGAKVLLESQAPPSLKRE